MVRKEIIYLLYDDSGLSNTCYIGKTNDVKRRFRQHLNNPGSPHTRKYRWLTFLKKAEVIPKIKILEEVREQDRWQDRERYWIKFLKDEGISLCNGTDGGDGVTLFGKDNGMFGKPSAMRGKVGAMKGKIGRMKGICGENHPAFGTTSPMNNILGENHPRTGMKQSEASKLKMSNSKKGKKNPNFGKSRKIVCLNDNKEFKSMADAARFYGISRDCINQVCLGNFKKTHGSFVFRYVEES